MVEGHVLVHSVKVKGNSNPYEFDKYSIVSEAGKNIPTVADAADANEPVYLWWNFIAPVKSCLGRQLYCINKFNFVHGREQAKEPVRAEGEMY